jgi:hypothetical protein
MLPIRYRMVVEISLATAFMNNSGKDFDMGKEVSL